MSLRNNASVCEAKFFKKLQVLTLNRLKTLYVHNCFLILLVVKQSTRAHPESLEKSWKQCWILLQNGGKAPVGKSKTTLNKTL